MNDDGCGWWILQLSRTQRLRRNRRSTREGIATRCSSEWKEISSVSASTVDRVWSRTTTSSSQISSTMMSGLALSARYEWKVFTTESFTVWLLGSINQGNCYCTRCLRNELIMKYKGIFMLLGGDINWLQRESLFEHFSHSACQTRVRFSSYLWLLLTFHCSSAPRISREEGDSDERNERSSEGSAVEAWSDCEDQRVETTSVVEFIDL